jgi:pimeloyl-ACP methyl ester carboxylesterase
LVKVPSGELFVTVKDEAGPQAQSIIFIHGLGGWHNNYEPVVRKAELAKTHRIIYFDLEGLGLSPLTGSPVTVKTYAQSVKEVLDHIGVQKAIVVGHSMGGVSAGLQNPADWTAHRQYIRC